MRVMPAPGTRSWKLLAPVDLASSAACRMITQAYQAADSLHAELTLLSVTPSGRFRRTLFPVWPHDEAGDRYPDVLVRRITVTGDPAPVIAACADRVAADAIVVPADYRAGRWFFRRAVAAELAALTWRPMWILPSGFAVEGNSRALRVACIVRNDPSDDRIVRFSEKLASHCNAEVRRFDGRFEQVDSLIDTIRRQGIGLVIAARPVYVKADAHCGDLVTKAHSFPCPLLSVPLVSALPWSSVPLHRRLKFWS